MKFLILVFLLIRISKFYFPVAYRFKVRDSYRDYKITCYTIEFLLSNRKVVVGKLNNPGGKYKFS